MPRLNKRTCPRCKKYEETFSQAEFCASCYILNKKEVDILREAEDIKVWGYQKIDGPSLDKHGHRSYKLLTPCNHEWSVPFCNLIKQVKNAKEKNLRPACGVCGPQHRMMTALTSYVEKNGIDYDLDEAIDYRRKVRGLTEVNYRRHKKVINPLNLKRGHHEHHIDHKVPIIECFKQGWTVEQAAAVDNLQMLTAQDNLAKGRHVNADSSVNTGFSINKM